jgi:hypothetical protein
MLNLFPKSRYFFVLYLNLLIRFAAFDIFLLFFALITVTTYLLTSIEMVH